MKNVFETLGRIVEPVELDPPLSVNDFVDGFKYEAWIGYEWTEVEFPKTGFGKSQLGNAIDKKLVRPVGINKTL